MSLTKKSEKLIKHFIDDFDKYCIKKTPNVQKSTDSSISELDILTKTKETDILKV